MILINNLLLIYYMEPLILGLLLTGLFSILVCPRLCVICTTGSEKKNNYQIMES